MLMGKASYLCQNILQVTERKFGLVIKRDEELTKKIKYRIVISLFLFVF